MRLSEGDIHYILTRAEKVKTSLGRGINTLILILTSAYLYNRYSSAGRPLLGRPEFCGICRSVGLRISARQLTSFMRKFFELGLYSPIFDRFQMLDRVWDSSKKALKLPDEAREIAYSMLESSNGRGTGRKPEVLVATAIYLACKSLGVRIAKARVARVMSVTPISIDHSTSLFRNDPDDASS